MLLKPFKTRLAFRSAAIILLIVSLVGLVFLGVGRTLVADHERQQQQQLLDGLLNTVDNTARIAVFLGDAQLAKEVATGLSQNITVSSVTISNQDGVLAYQSSTPGSRPQASDGLAIVREVIAPFGDPETIGEVRLIPNQRAIEEKVAQTTRFITLFFLGLLAAVALSIVLVVVTLITQPIARISNRLHGLKVEAGEKLEFPRGNETDEIGKLVGDVNAMIDYLVNLLSTEKQLRRERERDEKKFRAIVDNAETGIFMLDASGIIVSSNPAFRHLLSATEHDIEQRKLRFTDMLGESAPQMEALIRNARDSRESARGDIELGGAGTSRWLNVVISPIEEDQLQGVANDITERKLAQTAAEEQAVTDPLTGISNRLGFERKMQWMIETCLRYPSHRFALMMIDLDKFKDINDTQGHLAGDQVLVTVAERIGDLLRKTDFVARLGGDELAIIVDAVGQQDVLANIAKNVIETINQPIELDSGTAHVGASIGIAIYDRRYGTASELIRDADLAMYHAKHAGRNTYRFSQPDDE